MQNEKYHKSFGLSQTPLLRVHVSILRDPVYQHVGLIEQNRFVPVVLSLI